jgi:hypothetical protein
VGHTIRPVLLLHETHRVAGEAAEAFEVAYRDGWMGSLAASEDARLVWFLTQAHGTGPSYTVVTVTGLAGGAAWERLARRVEGGDLSAWSRDVSKMRHDSTSKLLAPVGWSPLQELVLPDLPTGGERPQTLYMEDTVHPHRGHLDEYLEAAGSLYARDTIGRRLAQGTSLLDVRGCFRTLVGAHAGNEVVLWQRVVRPELLLPLLTREVPAEHRAPGTWMHDALAYRDRWESRLLRTASWSPLD